MLPELRTVDELGAELWPTWDANRRRRWVYRQIEEHGLPVIRLGRSVVIDVAAVREWLAGQTTSVNEETAARRNLTAA
jgi:excisionase family DNA binding protein